MKTFVVEACTENGKEEFEYQAKYSYYVDDLFYADHPKARIISIVDKVVWDAANAHMIATNRTNEYYH